MSAADQVRAADPVVPEIKRCLARWYDGRRINFCENLRPTNGLRCFRHGPEGSELDADGTPLPVEAKALAEEIRKLARGA